MLPFCLFRTLSRVSFRARPALCSRISVSEMRDTQALGPPAPTWQLSLRHAGSLLLELAIRACTQYPETARAELLSWQALQLITTMCVDSPAEGWKQGLLGQVQHYGNESGLLPTLNWGSSVHCVPPSSHFPGYRQQSPVKCLHGEDMLQASHVTSLKSCTQNYSS